jgi:hypothetical protein
MAVINVALGGVAASALPPELRSTAADQEAVAVTIYNQDLALVKELRRVTLGEGQQRLALREVSARMRPETAQLRSVTDARALTLIEQNFDFDLLTPAKLLEKYVGRKVRVVRTNSKTGIETIEEAWCSRSAIASRPASRAGSSTTRCRTTCVTARHW